jgi:hypothetical protein
MAQPAEVTRTERRVIMKRHLILAALAGLALAACGTQPQRSAPAPSQRATLPASADTAAVAYTHAHHEGWVPLVGGVSGIVTSRTCYGSRCNPWSVVLITGYGPAFPFTCGDVAAGTLTPCKTPAFTFKVAGDTSTSVNDPGYTPELGDYVAMPLGSSGSVYLIQRAAIGAEG